eukprot:TRINITY_DN2873_c0_g1_i16.p1 TRINITY_DN2873_c0_g1~~TRINITY_DN2873_c0_g1_i16.p1  ORF type:complete len:211 (+),score=18.87 TRINITY_DN2873_c0_g1_i16:142-774(+)
MCIRDSPYRMPISASTVHPPSQTRTSGFDACGWDRVLDRHARLNSGVSSRSPSKPVKKAIRWKRTTIEVTKPKPTSDLNLDVRGCVPALPWGSISKRLTRRRWVHSSVADLGTRVSEEKQQASRVFANLVGLRRIKEALGAWKAKTTWARGLRTQIKPIAETTAHLAVDTVQALSTLLALALGALLGREISLKDAAIPRHGMLSCSIQFV